MDKYINNQIFTDPVVLGVVFFSSPGYIVYNNKYIEINKLKPLHARTFYESSKSYKKLQKVTKK
jgi:hypothetical protein